MTTHGSGPTRFFDDMSRLMTNAMGVAQGAKDEAETAMKGWVDRWLADRNLVTREEFEVVRDMAIKARTENAELRAMIAAFTGGTGAPQPGAHVSEAEAPAGDMSAPGGTAAVNTPHVSEAEAPPTDMTPPDIGGTAPGTKAPHVSETEAPPTDMTPPGQGESGKAGEDAGPHASQAEAPPADMNPKG